MLMADTRAPPVPVKSEQEPLVSDSHSEQRPRDLEHLLASISHFDHTHHGQMGTECVDTTGSRLTET